MHGPPETSMGENGEVSQATGAAGSEGAAAAGTGPRSRVVVVGSGPGGYEAALVAAQLGADVTVVDRDGVGGAAVLTDVVPSKTLIATAELMTLVAGSTELGVRYPAGAGAIGVDL